MAGLSQKIAVPLAPILCAVWYGWTHFYRDPGSIFFDERYAYEQRYSWYRGAQVPSFIDEHDFVGREAARGKAGDRPSLCVALTSVRRQYTQYLEGLTAQERTDLHLGVLIAETNPINHPGWNQEWIHQVVDEVYTYNVSEQDEGRLRDLERRDDHSEKGVYDYAYALQRCYETGAPYIGMFEDDIMLADGWLVRTLSGLSRLPAPDDQDSDSPWLFLRMFNQKRSTGWAKHHIGGNHEHWIIVGTALGVSVLVLLARRRWVASRAYLDSGSLCVLVLVLNPAL